MTNQNDSKYTWQPINEVLHKGSVPLIIAPFTYTVNQATSPPPSPCRSFQPGHSTPLVNAHNVGYYGIFNFFTMTIESLRKKELNDMFPVPGQVPTWTIPTQDNPQPHNYHSDNCQPE